MSPHQDLLAHPPVRRRAAPFSAAAALLLAGAFVLLGALPFSAGPTPALARQKAPLLDSGEFIRKPVRNAECQLGKQLHEIGSTWFADLGPPFGVMYCIRCECRGVQKKRRVVARVHCRNIKTECPKPSCDEPVLLPGRCCKVCPGDLHSPDIVQDVAPAVTEEEEKNMRDFAALLTGRTTPGDPQTAAVATGRFTFHRKSLYYSFYHSTSLPAPKKVQFLDAEGSILDEHEVTLDVYQNATGKVCGVWRRLPRAYRKYLREGTLSVGLVWDRPTGKGSASDTLSGRIGRYKALPTEMFSAVLEAVDVAPTAGPNGRPPLEEEASPVSGVHWGKRVVESGGRAPLLRGAGGTAIVSASAATPSIHVQLLFNGAFSPHDVSDVPLVVRLESDKILVVEEIVRIPKPDHEMNVIEVRSAVKAGDLRLLARGRLHLAVFSRRHPEYRLEGVVHTRVACDLFQATLSPPPEGEETAAAPTNAATAPAPSRASGLAWMFLTRDGALVYRVRLDDMDAPLMSLRMASRAPVGPQQLRGIPPPRRHEMDEDLTPSFRDGWANGSLDRLSPRELEQLYAGEAWVMGVSDDPSGSSLKGRLTVHPAAGARASEGPILLKRNDLSTPAALVGIAWVAVDSDCNLQYEIMLSGLEDWVGPGDRPLNLYLEDTPAMVPGAPVSRRLLDEFRGPQLEGFTMNLSDSELARIEYGVAFLEVVDPSPSATQQSLLRARITQVRVPMSCLPPETNSLTTQDDNQLPNSNSCYYEGSFYNEGDQWIPNRESCAMCSCHHRQVKCEPVLCPPTSCPRGVTAVNKSGDCCPSCSNSTGSHESNTSETRGCYLAKQFYKAGTSWHPYVPPFGFDTCAVCTCDIQTLEIRCPRMQCPPLSCPEKEAIRPNKKACCKECPPTVPHDTNQLKDQGNPRSEEDILAAGGCKFTVGGPFENGREWHPRIHPHGEEKCIKCRCKDGAVKCDRKRCPRSTCKRRSHHDKDPARDDECCNQCRRNRSSARGHRRGQHAMAHTKS
ncbi:dorsal-ventral patterning protein Sog [Ischnura elegans]|uniref:dorsal-ventral patterning protein Sog n=1 Tax=Ischnura elegans TaxID=197161 RepID=UPI001ED898AE|nr:dorsal-ventral patterning protein Sog [Ischnura elegans]XP_046389734.1 dorsal-ventral patterning protein Sog [Ischnura elegans]XP_046389735.1 dorsal-ventral patterning protein Sog [Ischnura elegans]XP_046389736.1 dorsal-ventral patterning protein Sog [Ischnura elegans]